MQIKVSEILNDLANGLDRKAIREKYNLSPAQMKMLFQHPQLKGRKVKKAVEPIEIIDDITENVVEEPVEVESYRPAEVETLQSEFFS